MPLGKREAEKLRKRIDWLNGEGGFDDKLLFEKVEEASQGVDLKNVFSVLKELEEKKDGIKDPLAWATKGIRGKRGSGDDAREEGNLRKKIGFLNKAGGFENTLIYDKIYAAALGLDYTYVFKVLDQLEEKHKNGETFKDATAYVCSAFRKAGGGSGEWHHAPDPYAGYYDPRQYYMPGPPPPPLGYGYGPMRAPPGGWMPQGGMSKELDQALRKRIGWLNKDGGFENAINYQKVVEAAEAAGGALAKNKALDILNKVEEKKDEIKDPTGWVCAGFKKAAREAGPYDMSPIAAYGHPYGLPIGAGGKGAGSAQSRGGDVDSTLRKKIGFLNKSQGGNDIIFDKVKDEAVGLGRDDVLRVLTSFEEKRESVKDPTAWIIGGLRKAGGGGIKRGGKGGGKGDRVSSSGGVRKTIGK